MQEKSISLYSDKGGADKVYNVFLVASGNDFKVNYQNGARGCTLTNGSKTTTPVPYDKAITIFDKLVKEKMTGSSKYRVSDGAAPTAALEAASTKQASGLDPQLLNSIDALEAGSLVADRTMYCQEKFDGERRLVVYIPEESAKGINKKGDFVPLLASLAAGFEGIKLSLTLDGEQIGDQYFVFDVLERGGKCLKNEPYFRRIDILEELRVTTGSQWKAAGIKIVETAHLTDDKRALIKAVQDGAREGVVFKDVNSKYRPGRPASGGEWLKWKFTESATVEVIGHTEGKRSVEMAVYDDQGMLQSLGNVTIPGKIEMPGIGTFIEVKYLYANRTGGLTQPVFLGRRNDSDRSDCTIAQLKYKGLSA